jgi:glycerol-3-phosphate acyltransferase PlsY
MIVVLLIGCYLIGSIPVAWIIAKLVTGEDIREMGSGNVGVLNTGISVARWAGLLVFVAEAAKGALAVFLARWMGFSDVVTGCAALAAISGTRWSVWMRGAGGRGNTAAMAALLVISWQTLAVSLGLWLAARVVSRSSFIATRIALVVWPFIFGFITHSWLAVAIGAIFSVLFSTTHSSETDDHLLLKNEWDSLAGFLTAPRRK